MCIKSSTSIQIFKNAGIVDINFYNPIRDAITFHFFEILQGPENHVMCYRIFAGEPSTNPLGSGYQSACVSMITFRISFALL